MCLNGKKADHFLCRETVSDNDIQYNAYKVLSTFECYDTFIIMLQYCRSPVLLVVTITFLFFLP